VIYVNIPELYQPSIKPFNDARPVILQIGTARNKNLERIIPALEGLSCRYRILGPLTEAQAALLKKHKLEYEQFDRLDSDAEVYDLYKSCDIVSFASTVEGFGMPILEGNATGRVVVTGNTSSMPEIAADAACLVDPWDIDSIRTGFRKVISDPDYRNRLIRNGFQNVKRFDKEQIAHQYFNLYRELVSNG
jgi:glycosyltransferase involved in cell wall biosynthesis